MPRFFDALTTAVILAMSWLLMDSVGAPRERAWCVQAQLYQHDVQRGCFSRSARPAESAPPRNAAEKRPQEAEREREEARARTAAPEGEVKDLRDAAAEAKRPFWRRWLG
jgi:hypothetical protein